MKQIDFVEYYEKNKQSYEDWGNYIVNKIYSTMNETGHDIDFLIKIPPKPRLKTLDSSLSKIGRKGYTDPSKQITDIIGVRFVVLLSHHIDIITNIINDIDCWEAKKSRDYQSEIDQNPKIFDYQSKHFELRPKKVIEFNDRIINNDICCEVQVRTLLQHAYAEIVHDNLYKPTGKAPEANIERKIARSMALMETTDELFCDTMKILSDTNKEKDILYSSLAAIYNDKISGEYVTHFNKKTNYILLEEFEEELKDDQTISCINNLLEKKKYIPLKIQARAKENYFFYQPICTLVYLLAEQMDSDLLLQRWPLPGSKNSLEIILSDLGKSTGLNH